LETASLVIPVHSDRAARRFAGLDRAPPWCRLAAIRRAAKRRGMGAARRRLVGIARLFGGHA